MIIQNNLFHYNVNILTAWYIINYLFYYNILTKHKESAKYLMNIH